MYMAFSFLFSSQLSFLVTLVSFFIQVLHVNYYTTEYLFFLRDTTLLFGGARSTWPEMIYLPLYQPSSSAISGISNISCSWPHDCLGYSN